MESGFRMSTRRPNHRTSPAESTAEFLMSLQAPGPAAKADLIFRQSPRSAYLRSYTFTTTRAESPLRRMFMPSPAGQRRGEKSSTASARLDGNERREKKKKKAATVCPELRLPPGPDLYRLYELALSDSGPDVISTPPPGPTPPPGGCCRRKRSGLNKAMGCLARLNPFACLKHGDVGVKKTVDGNMEKSKAKVKSKGQSAAEADARSTLNFLWLV